MDILYGVAKTQSDVTRDQVSLNDYSDCKYLIV